MRMTPLDIHSHRFGRRWNGLDPEEVEAFLRMVAEDYEGLLRENQQMEDRIRRLGSELEELRADERLLKETLLSAQSMTEDLRRAALKEAEVVLSGAEVKAEKVIDASHRRAAQLSQEIREMRGLRSRLATSLRSCIETHLKLIDGLEEDPADEGGNVTYLSRGAERSPGSPPSKDPADSASGS